jgi:RNA polymerase sigma-70 factor (ECF subfamily)
LILFCESRREARRDAAGRFVPLAEQDTTRWSRELITEAEHVLIEASRARAPGRFQLEAAIQSAHAQRMFTGTTNWRAVALLHAALARCAPTVGAQVSHAAALTEAGEPEAALALLGTLPVAAVAAYQPFHATRAHALAKLFRFADAGDSYRRAIGLSEDPAVREFLSERMAALPS